MKEVSLIQLQKLTAINVLKGIIYFKLSLIGEYCLCQMLYIPIINLRYQYDTISVIINQ